MIIEFLESVSVVGLLAMVAGAVVCATVLAYRRIFHIPTPVPDYTDDAVPLQGVCPHGFFRDVSAMAAEGLATCGECIGELADPDFTIMATCPACYKTDYHPFTGPINAMVLEGDAKEFVRCPVVDRICTGCGFAWLQH